MSEQGPENLSSADPTFKSWEADGNGEKLLSNIAEEAPNADATRKVPLTRAEQEAEDYRPSSHITSTNDIDESPDGKRFTPQDFANASLLDPKSPAVEIHNPDVDPNTPVVEHHYEVDPSLAQAEYVGHEVAPGIERILPESVIEENRRQGEMANEQLAKEKASLEEAKARQEAEEQRRLQEEREAAEKARAEAETPKTPQEAFDDMKKMAEATGDGVLIGWIKNRVAGHLHENRPLEWWLETRKNLKESIETRKQRGQL